jgi:small subunit ribosomal protein S20
VANTPSARKRAKQSEKRRQHNASLRSTMRTFIKKVISATSAGNKEDAQTALKAAVPVIDKMATKGVIHKATAARYKSRLNARVKKLVTA